MPRQLARLGMRLLSHSKPALASIFGIGLVIDTQEARWDDHALVRYGVTPRSIAEHLSLSSDAHLS